jgi:hypothetical protein
VKKLGVGFAIALGLVGARAHAAVPAGYTGMPFKGAPWPIPGRIDFENFDEGGMGVAWQVDDHTGNFGEGGCPANDYREGIHPQLCKTNTNAGENDLFSTGPMMGMPYPSAAMPQSIYIGYTHGVDWVKLTVNVAVAGTYKVSSTWASEPGGADGIKMEISFNDVVKAAPSLPGTGGYHNWVAFADFATVELEAGVQVLKFAAKSQHLNYDYLQFSRVLPGGGVDDGSGNPGGGGSGGTGAGGASGAGGAAGAAGSASGGTPTTAGAGAGGSGLGGEGAGGSPLPSGGTGGVPPAGGSGSNAAGVPNAAAGATTTSGGSGTTGAPGASTSNVEQDSSCSVSAGAPRAGVAALAAFAAFAAALSSRRSRRRRA